AWPPSALPWMRGSVWSWFPPRTPLLSQAMRLSSPSARAMPPQLPPGSGRRRPHRSRCRRRRTLVSPVRQDPVIGVSPVVRELQPAGEGFSGFYGLHPDIAGSSGRLARVYRLLQGLVSRLQPLWRRLVWVAAAFELEMQELGGRRQLGQ